MIQTIKGDHPSSRMRAADKLREKLLKKDEKLLGLINDPDYRFTDGKVHYEKVAVRVRRSAEKLKSDIFYNFRGRVLDLKGNCEREKVNDTPTLWVPSLKPFLFQSHQSKTKAFDNEAVNALKGSCCAPQDHVVKKA